MAKGKKTGGRRKGTPNKVTANAKQAIEQAFEGAGGVKEFTAWAIANRTEFYTRVFPRILPKEVEHSADESLASLIAAAYQSGV